ncbi:six-hairpin glycosidase [Zobellia galactanivorans]|uniref:six-hairpin glycosidase n=1 Tax=Zobellia galactanivorans (strain DSM 12802 / CCUG 47099 / CIP 106680 / NCIMB 13871 / Dsij) TaxID=63186 RepID=UPI0026E2F9F6|nr:six-hairpin glycosidase [Zobellia galactanivorans]MDO6809770.1 six-hairpin glycosidase [Zobellia galactanivorans]
MNREYKMVSRGFARSRITRATYAVMTCFCLLTTYLSAQGPTAIPLPENLEQGYPRLYITQSEKKELQKTIKKEQWAKEVLQGIHERIDAHVERHVTDPEWMVSRLQMYWKTKATNVYVNGVDYSHADGEAPVPTVRFTGSRNSATQYAKPKLEEIMPYMDDPRGLYLPNKTKEDRPFEWVEQSKTGNIIVSINEEIIGLARDAAFISWLENDERYSKFAYDIFHTYMEGMSYRSEPIDLLNGHIQTLVGFTHFQVIHERALREIAILYDFLHPFIEANHPENIAMYDKTIKRWTDQVIKNGVPQNNWNLHQANIILKAAMVLQDNDHYEDKKGREYYVNYILNVTSARQWSLTKFIDYGYDESNGVWNECPSYSLGVTSSLTHFIRDFDNTFDHNLLPYTPVITKAVKMMPQYLFPNNQIVAFGDSYYGPISTEAIADMIRIAQKNGNHGLEEEFTGLYRLFVDDNQPGNNRGRNSKSIASLFASKPLELNPKYKKHDIKDYMTQTFNAPNVSWHVQRMGTGKDGMMVSLNGSLGNHMHANGINMELYGKGFVQGADPGKGANYLEPIYLEYYSQFPAHNTVMVDGASSYTEMLSYHAFDLMGEYPKSEQKSGYYVDITYSDVYFLEPETRSDQSRLVSIVRTGKETGYYVDVFRSKKQRKGDKFHDYYYHNLGQSMKVMDADGHPLELSPSEEMAFAGGHLYALDYMWDKKSVRLEGDYQTEWKIDFPEGQEDVFMNLWMKGTEGREVFAIKSPPNKAFRGDHGLPYEVDKAPYLTLAARQHGPAWEKPFVAVYEPFTSAEGKSIEKISGFADENGNPEFTGIHIRHKSGREDFVFSSANHKKVNYKGMATDATYTLVGHEKNGDWVVFVGNGKEVAAKGYTISASDIGNVVLELRGGELFLHNEVPVTIAHTHSEVRFNAGALRKITLE